jgi:V8-like Glu-specific endopeptidase
LFLIASPAGAALTREDGAQVREYWTPERMETAIPGDALLRDAAAVVPIGDLDLGLGPAETQRAHAQAVGNPRSKPFRTHGKVFFTLGGLDYVCSGTSVKSNTDSLVVTAGHCVYSKADNYASNFMFAPAYDNGPSKYGEWTAKKLKATPQWENNENISYDVGMATMNKRNGKTLADKVGKRGIAFKKSRNQKFDVFGYPAEGDFNGERMFRCDSPAEGKDNSQNNPEPTRIDCDMTGGSSGGGWVIGGKNVNSVVSYGYECGVGPLPLPIPCNNPEEGKLFGPYFGGEIKKLYRSQK